MKREKRTSWREVVKPTYSASSLSSSSGWMSPESLFQMSLDSIASALIEGTSSHITLNTCREVFGHDTRLTNKLIDVFKAKGCISNDQYKWYIHSNSWYIGGTVKLVGLDLHVTDIDTLSIFLHPDTSHLYLHDNMNLLLPSSRGVVNDVTVTSRGMHTREPGLARLLDRCATHLTHLDISNCMAGPDIAALLARTILKLPCLKVLNVSRNSLTSFAIKSGKSRDSSSKHKSSLLDPSGMYRARCRII